MRRRFGRRNRSEGRSGLDAGPWLERLRESGVLEGGSLEPLALEGVPAAVAVGQDEAGRPLVVAFSPRSGGDAVLAALAVGAERAREGGRAIAIAPVWDAPARRLLSLAAPRGFAWEARQAPALAEDGVPAVEGDEEPLVLPPLLVAGQIADAGQRNLFVRAVAGLEGLAAKHGGGLRGAGPAVELVLLARRVAVLSTDLLLETVLPARSGERLSESGLADALDRLEGQLRKRLNDRRVRDEEEGLRGRAIADVAGAASLRALARWPLPGSDPEVLDFAGLDADGRPVAGAIRRRLGLEGLGEILDAALALRAALPALLASAPPPVRLDTPRLIVAAESFDDAALRALGEISLEVARVPLAGGAGAPQTVSEGRPRRRSRGRGRRRRDEGAGERVPDRGPAERVPDRGPAERVPDRGAAERVPAPERAPAAEPEPRRFEEVTAFDLDDTGGEPPRERRGRRGRRRGRPAPAPRETEEPADEEPDEAPSEPEAPEEDLWAEREARLRARMAKGDPEPEPLPEESRAERPRRAALLVHADRACIAAALLLAREVRVLDGLWIYPQDELMTFFRGVATDLREDTCIFVVGFTARPARDVLQAAGLYRGRLVWYDHHAWPPEDLGALRQALGDEAVHVVAGLDTPLPLVVADCTRRSRFSEKLVDLATARFSEHDFTRWGRFWWSKLADLTRQSGDRRAEIEPLLAGRPSDLARAAARQEAPPLPPELSFVSERDFGLAHFGGYELVLVPTAPGLDVCLTGRIARERHDAQLSLAWREGDELLVLAGSDGLNLQGMAEHLGNKLAWVESLPGDDHVARFRVRGLPERIDALVAEIAMGRTILEG